MKRNEKATKNSNRATELLDELLKDYHKLDDIIGDSGLLKQLTHHLGYEPP